MGWSREDEDEPIGPGGSGTGVPAIGLPRLAARERQVDRAPGGRAARF